MKIAICEDNLQDLEVINEYIKIYCMNNRFAVEVYTYTKAESLLEAYIHEKFEIIFMDILMDGMTGIDAAHKIREISEACVIVFITASEDYSLEAYAADGVAYVLKPVDDTNMKKALDKCRKELINNGQYITVSIGRQGLVDIPLANICYVEVYNKEVCFHVGTQKVITFKMTLDEIEEKLGGEPFLRCHRSYIVNMNYIVALKNGELKMKNGERLFLPGRRYAQMQLAFGKFLTKRLREEHI